MKKSSFYILTLSLYFLLTGCSKKEHIELRIIGEAQPPLEALESIKSSYEESTGIKIIVEQYEFETAIEKVTLDLSSKNGQYDIVLQPHISLGKFVESGFLEPVEQYLNNPEIHDSSFNPNEAIFQKFWKELSWYDEKCYGYPFTANTMYLCYRKDLLNNPENKNRFKEIYKYELEIPNNWKQYYDIAEFFTDKSNGFYGTSIQGKRHPALWYEWLNFATSFGGGVMEKDHAWEYGPIIINSPKTIKATKYYKSLMQFSPPDILNYTWDDVIADMQQGRLFMCIMWSDATFALEDTTLSKVAGKMGYAMIPEGEIGKTGQIAGWSYLISKYSKQKEEAYKFIEWMMKPNIQIEQQKLGGASAILETYKDSSINSIPYTEAYVNTLEVAISMSESVPEASQISDLVQKGLSNILSEKYTVEEGLNLMANELNKLLQGKSELKYPSN